MTTGEMLRERLKTADLALEIARRLADYDIVVQADTLNQVAELLGVGKRG